jgi:transposase
VLRIARTGAVKSRTAAFNQLKDLIITAPDSLRETLRDKTLQRVAVESARLRPDTSRLADPTQATKLALRTIAVRAAALNTEITALDTQLGELVTAAAPRTLALLGVGTEHAAQLVITAGGNPNGCDQKRHLPHSARPVRSPPAAARPTATGSTPPVTGKPTAPST